MKTIVTERLRLAPIGQAQAQDLLALLQDASVTQTYMVPDLQTSAEKTALVQRLCAMSASPGQFMCGIYRQDRLIGLIHQVDVQKDEIELGYVVVPAYQNKGYATEALKAAIAALPALGYRVVKAGAFADNAASICVMEKCGMRRLAQTETVFYRGQSHQCVYYAITVAP